MLRKDHLWCRAQSAVLAVSEAVGGGIDIGFDKRISSEMQAELRAFVHWVEERFSVPIRLWVDFEYRHYLVSREGKRAGFLFYWSDFSNDSVFDNADDIPMLRLPVRTERSSVEDVLCSFIEGICCYFAWILGEIQSGYQPNEEEVESVFDEYMKWKNNKKELH